MNDMVNISIPAETLAENCSFSKKEKLLAYAAIVLGFLIIKLSAAPLFLGALCRIGAGTSAVLLGILLFSTIYNAQRNKFTVKKIANIALCAVFSINVFISSNTLIQFLDTVFVLLMIAYDNLTDDKRFSSIRKYFPIDLLNAVFTLPFSEFGTLPKSLREENSQKSKVVKSAACGLAIAVIPTSLICTLLMSADGTFMKTMNDLFDNGFSKIIVFLIQIALGIPAAFYLFGMCRARKINASERLIGDDIRINDGLMKIGFVSHMTGVFSVIPICIIYVIFFFTQLSYFLSSFISKLPSNMDSYAEYARRGFFELCAVSVINLAVIIALGLFCRRKENGQKEKSIRVITSVLCVFTIMLIATAISKMVMYINVYGLTPLRVYTTWFMLLLTFVFLGIIINSIRDSFNVSKLTVTVFTIMFGLLSFCNIDGIIAGYNGERYINHTLGEFDIGIIYELSTGAVPTLKSLDFSPQDREMIDRAINDNLDRRFMNSDLRTITLSDIIAERYANEE